MSLLTEHFTYENNTYYPDFALNGAFHSLRRSCIMVEKWMNEFLKAPLGAK
jgi:hypothetical protein